MRGKGWGAKPQSFLCGITPAYAGKRSGTGFLQEWQRDHPRLCGEKLRVRALGRFRRGSPPPMRGKDGNARVSGDAWGITPAYAGKSITDAAEVYAILDHPRLCGEKPTIARNFSTP